MTLFEIVGLYLALILIINIVLMYRVGQVRIAKKINLGDGGDPLMNSRMRAHGNFIETAPLIILGMIGMAMLSALPVFLHGVGIALIIGRLAHAHGMATGSKGRFIGTLLFMLTSLFIAGFILFKIIAS